jgi:hypothetical protein
MGLGLRIYPLFNKEHLEKHRILHLKDTLSFDGNYRILGQIDHPRVKIDITAKFIHPIVKTHLLRPKLIEIPTHKGFEIIGQDAYCDPLTYAFVGGMRRMRVPSNSSSRDKAIMNYVRTLDNDTPIVLFWC